MSDNIAATINPFDKSRRHKVKVEFTNGDTIETEINGTPDQVVGYYIGRNFNFGINGDKMTKGAKIWFWDGERYLQHKETINTQVEGK